MLGTASNGSESSAPMILVGVYALEGVNRRMVFSKSLLAAIARRRLDEASLVHCLQDALRCCEPTAATNLSLLQVTCTFI